MKSNGTHWTTSGLGALAPFLGYRGAVPSKPGIAKADRPRSGSFSSLVSRAPIDQSALDALVFAYEELGPAERRSLVRAVLNDAKAAAPVLAGFLLVEEEPGSRKRLEALILRHAVVRRSTWAAGTSQCGRAVLAQGLDGGWRDVLWLSWRQSEIVDLEIQGRLEPSFSPGTDLVPTDPAALVEVLTPMLWRHLRRRAPVPSGLDRFAGFFSLG